MPEAVFTPEPVDTTKMRELVRLGLVDGDMPGAPGDDHLQDFFTARDSLTRLWKFADSRTVSPWAMLGVVLARLVAAIEPELVLPPLIGGYGSLNMFVGLVGLPGQGKGAAMSAGLDAVQFHRPGSIVPVDTDTVTPGSGEGLVKLFVPPKPEKDKPAPVARSRALVSESEITSMAALGGRSGATLVPTLLKMWAGEHVGFTNADADRTTSIKAHTYRMCMVSQIQPGNAPALLDHVDSGLPQRFLWLPVQVSITPRWGTEPVDSLMVPVPRRDQRTVMTLPDDVVAYVRDDYRQRGSLSFSAEVDPMEGHYNMLRLKVAAALALLEGRAGVTPEDWELSRLVMNVHNETLHMVRETLASKRAKASAAKAERREQDADEVERKRARRAKAHLLKHLGQLSKPERFPVIRRAARGDIRDTVDMLMARWETAGLVTVERSDGGVDMVAPLTECQRRGIEVDEPE